MEAHGKILPNVAQMSADFFTFWSVQLSMCLYVMSMLQGLGVTGQPIDV